MQSTRILEMTKDLIGIMEKYNLTKLFHFLMWYILENKQLAKLLQGEKIKTDEGEMVKFLIESSGMKVVEKDDEYVTLRIHTDTTGKDLQQYWPEIQKSMNKKTGRKQVSNNTGRDLRILSLKNKGMKAIDITEMINSDPNFKDQKIAYQDIPNIIKRIKTKADKNISN